MSVEELDSVIECRDLEFAYAGKPVLHGINFSVPGTGITGLLGKNGTGKSTTINILMGFLRPTRGECRVLGHPSHAIPPEARRDIGLVHEGFIQFDYMTIAEIERFHSAFYPRWDKEVYFDLVDRLNVPYDRVVARMSCGQRSQVTLGLVLAQRPKLMILDDYSMGLDVGYRRLFLELLREYIAVQGGSVLLTSHVVHELDGLVDNVIMLREGRIIAQGSTAEVMGNLRQYRLPLSEQTLRLKPEGLLVGVERHPRSVTVYTHASEEETRTWLTAAGIDCGNMEPVPMDLEDAFIGLTGRY